MAKADRVPALPPHPPPERFAAGPDPLWTDPHVATRMLAAHLDASTAAASRPPEAIDAAVGWLARAAGLRAGQRVLDLGCGPGLYTRRFAERGADAMGIDISAGSIAYARSADPRSRYVRGDYTVAELGRGFDLALFIYGDLCVLPEAQRDTVLRRVRRALAPGGRFAVEVTTPAAYAAKQGTAPSWTLADGPGFWSARPHLAIHRVVDYPPDTLLDWYCVVDDLGAIRRFHVWNRYYGLEDLRAVLLAAGFEVESVHADLTGAPFDAEAPWLAVIARPRAA